MGEPGPGPCRKEQPFALRGRPLEALSVLPRVWASLPAQQTGRHAVWLRRGRYALLPGCEPLSAPPPTPTPTPLCPHPGTASVPIRAHPRLHLLPSVLPSVPRARLPGEHGPYPTSGPICACARVLAQPHPSPVRMVTAHDVRPRVSTAPGHGRARCGVCALPPAVLSPGGSAHRSLPSCHAHTRPVRGLQLSPPFHRCGD